MATKLSTHWPALAGALLVAAPMLIANASLGMELGRAQIENEDWEVRYAQLLDLATNEERSQSLLNLRSGE